MFGAGVGDSYSIGDASLDRVLRVEGAEADLRESIEVGTANLPINIVDFRGFDSSIVL